jgi:hypothetical protein
MATVNDDDARQAAATGTPYVGFGPAQDPGGVTGFGSAYDFPQTTGEHFKGVSSENATDDSLGPDMDGD